jgi:hypothetical protein
VRAKTLAGWRKDLHTQALKRKSTANDQAHEIIKRSNHLLIKMFPYSNSLQSPIIAVVQAKAEYYKTR